MRGGSSVPVRWTRPYLPATVAGLPPGATQCSAGPPKRSSGLPSSSRTRGCINGCSPVGSSVGTPWCHSGGGKGCRWRGLGSHSGHFSRAVVRFSALLRNSRLHPKGGHSAHVRTGLPLARWTFHGLESGVPDAPGEGLFLEKANRLTASTVAMEKVVSTFTRGNHETSARLCWSDVRGVDGRRRGPISYAGKTVSPVPFPGPRHFPRSCYRLFMATARKERKPPTNKPAASTVSETAAAVKVVKPEGLELTEDQAATLTKLQGGLQLDKALAERVALQVTGLNESVQLDLHNKLGGLILKEFFKGKMENYRAVGRLHTSFRAMLSSGIEVTKAKVFYGVRIHHQLSVLGPLGKKLSYTHHRHLSQLKDDEVMKEVAGLAVKGRWSHKRLHTEVKKRKGGGGGGEVSRRGRPSHPAFRLGVQTMMKGLDQAVQGEVQRLVEFYSPQENDTPERAAERKAEGEAFLKDLGELEKGFDKLKKMKVEAEKKINAIDVSVAEG